MPKFPKTGPMTVKIVTHDPDPFMRTINKRLDNTLFNELQISKSVAELFRELGIPDDASPAQIRSDFRYRSKAKELPRWEERLAPFRGVVMSVEPCNGDGCTR